MGAGAAAAEGVALYVSVPVACFRAPQAREYLETLPVPPPSTVYGMLLSLVGETNRLVHQGAEVALAPLGQTDLPRSTVLRTVWRIKNNGLVPGHQDTRYGPGQNPEDFGVKDPRGGNRRPDFQELLTGVELAVFVRAGRAEAADPSLETRVARALAEPASVRRFGGLSLGESTHLVDEIRLLRPQDDGPARVLVSDPAGDLPLPIWPDHVGSAGTRWGQFALREVVLGGAAPDGVARIVPEEAWVVLRPSA